MAANTRRKRQADAEPAAAPAEPVSSAAGAIATDDTAARALTRAERTTLGMDAWEPSLLRELLQAHNRLPIDKG